MNTGGAAFPSPGVVLDDRSYQKQQGAYEGMTLRDYFAAKAIDECLRACVGFESAAEEAYMMADAMLKARDA